MVNEIKFTLKTPEEKHSIILVVYRYSGKKLVLSTGIKIIVSHWNSRRNRINIKSGYMEYPGYNNRLDRYKRALRDVESRFTQLMKVPSLVEFKEAIRVELNGGIANAKGVSTVFGYIKKVIQNKKAENRAVGTIQGYDQLLNIFKTFPDGRSVSFEDLSKERLSALTTYMVRKKSLGSGTINKLQRRLMTVVNEAESDGLKINPALRGKGWRVKAPQKEVGIALTKEEIKKIREVDLEENYQLVRDRFLIGLSTGQRFIDFKDLSIDNVVYEEGKYYFNIVQKKTKKLVKIPVSKKAKLILDKYEGYPPSIYEQKFNSQLKLICKEAGLERQVIIRKENPIDGIYDEKKLPIHEIVSSHDCRRTYATLQILDGVPASIVMKVTGHANLKTFSNYLRIQLNQLGALKEVF